MRRATFRNGKAIVCKEVEFTTDSRWNNVEFSRMGFEINYRDNTISVYWLRGGDPYVSDLMKALLADRDVRRLIKVYQERGRRNRYLIHQRVGMSGCEDYWIQVGFQNGPFFKKTKPKKLLHISCDGKLNEGWGEDNSMYIGDFVELASYLNFAKTMEVKALRKESNVRYVKPKHTGYLGDQGFTTEVTTLL